MNNESKNDPSTPQSDDLMDRLHLADPIDMSELPSVDEPTPQMLLEKIMTSTSPEIENDRQHPAVTATAPRQPRRLGLMAGAAAAVLLLVGGVFAFAPANTEPALAVVHGAAAATAGTDTGRVTVTLTGEGTDGAESDQVAAEVNVTFAGDSFAATADVTEMPDQGDFEELPVTESRLVDGTIYVNDNGQWYQVEAPEFLSQQLLEIVDPRSVLTTVQELVETQEVGTVTVDGVETTHYRSVVDLADESLNQAGWLAMEASDIDAEGEVTIDLYIDGEGLLRQLDVSGDLQEPENGEGSASFEVTTKFFDLGADISVEAPTDAIVIDPLSGEGFDIDE